VAALRRLQDGVAVAQVARKFNVTRKTVRDWRQRSEQIFDQTHKRNRRRTVGMFFLYIFPNVFFNYFAGRRRPKGAVSTT
jgi:hypothetical protein